VTPTAQGVHATTLHEKSTHCQHEAAFGFFGDQSTELIAELIINLC